MLEETECELKKLELLKRLQKVVVGVSVFGAFLGALMATVGFHEWYFRLQVFVDKAVESRILD